MIVLAPNQVRMLAGILANLGEDHSITIEIAPSDHRRVYVAGDGGVGPFECWTLPATGKEAWGPRRLRAAPPEASS